MKRALVLLLILMVLVMMVFLGISCKTAAGTIVAETTAAETAAAGTIVAETTAKAADELTMWIEGHYPDALETMLADFTADTGIKLDITVITDTSVFNTKWAAGERPDVLQFTAQKAQFNGLLPDQNFIDLADQPWVSKTLPGILENTSKYGDKVYGAVIEAPFVWGVWYNKEIFNKLALPIPSGYDGFSKFCGDVKKAGYTPLMAGGGDQWPLQFIPYAFWTDFMMKNNYDFVNKLNKNEATFEDPNIVKTFQDELDLFKAGYFNKDVLTATYNDEPARVFDGKALMLYQGHWVIQAMLDSYGLDAVNAKIGFFPISEEGNSVQWSVSTEFCIPKSNDEAKITAAKDFLNYITGPRYQKYLIDAKTPSTLEGFNNPKNIPTALVDAFAYFAKNPNGVWNLLAPEPNYGKYLQEMLYDQLTPEGVGKACQEEWVTSAKSVGLPGF